MEFFAFELITIHPDDMFCYQSEPTQEDMDLFWGMLSPTTIVINSETGLKWFIKFCESNSLMYEYLSRSVMLTLKTPNEDFMNWLTIQGVDTACVQFMGDYRDHMQSWRRWFDEQQWEDSNKWKRRIHNINR